MLLDAIVVYQWLAVSKQWRFGFTVVDWSDRVPRAVARYVQK